MAGQRQTQAGATKLPAGAVVGLGKGVEQQRLLCRRDADAGITHLKAHQHPAGGLLQLLGTQAHPAAVGELDRVGQEVEQGLRQARGVTAQALRQVVGIQHQFQAFLACPLGHHRAATRQQRIDRKHGVLQRQLAGLDLGQVEDVADELQQVLGGSGEFVDAVTRQAVMAVAAHQVGQADDGVHRGADLVAHVGQKGALGAAGGLGGVTRFTQCIGGLFLLGAVDGHHHQANHHAVAPVGQAMHLGPLPGAVLRDVGTLKVLGLAGQRDTAQWRPGAVIALRHQLRRQAPQRGLGAAAVPVVPGPVGVAAALLGIEVDDAPGQVVGNGMHQPVGVVQGLVGAAQLGGALSHGGRQVGAFMLQVGLQLGQLGDVARHAKQAGDLACRVAQRAQRGQKSALPDRGEQGVLKRDGLATVQHLVFKCAQAPGLGRWQHGAGLQPQQLCRRAAQGGGPSAVDHLQPVV